METNDLIKILTADARRPAPSLPLIWWGAVGLAMVVAALVFAALLGPRPDIAAAAKTPRFLMKLALTIALATSAIGAGRALLSPQESWRKAYLAVGPAMLLLAVTIELLV